jgi:hypothetical protein
MELLTGGGPYVPSVPQVPKPRAEVPHPWGVELQASLPPHFNLPGLCGLMPAAPWKGPAVLTTEVPNRAVAQWLTEVGKLRPTEFTWTVALMLLQRSAALECLEVHGAILAKLQPESLLLMAPRGCVPAGPPRLLLADFRLVHQWPQGPLGLHSLPLARLLCTLLSDPRPSTMPLAVGLKAVLPHTRPSAALTCTAGTALGAWARAMQTQGPAEALAAGAPHAAAHALSRVCHGWGGAWPGGLALLYLAEATEASLGHVVELCGLTPS